MIRFSFARPVYIDQRKQQTSPFIKMFGLHCMLDFLPWLVFYLTDSLFPRRHLSSNFTKLSPCADKVYISDRESQTAVSEIMT